MGTTNITIIDSVSTSTTGQGGQTIITGTPTNGSVAYISPEQIKTEVLNSFSVSVSGTWTGTLQFETTVDTINWVPYDAQIIGVGTTVSTITGNGSFKGNVAAVKQVRLRATATITGSAVVNFDTAGGNDIQHIELDTSGISIGTVSINQTTPGTTNGVVVVPSSTAFPSTGFTDNGTATATATALPSHVITLGAFLQNSGGSNLYVGFSNAITSTTGYQIVPNGQLPLFTNNSNVYYVLGSGTWNLVGA